MRGRRENRRIGARATRAVAARFRRDRSAESDRPTFPATLLRRSEPAGEALNALSEEHRTILVLRGVEGFDYDQIAEILELSAGTVRSRLHRARVQFRNQLDHRAG
ncbi:MAG: sigma-70 family RNA polymerase sigma factor [Planctomycetota bacterium]|nr:sigma-70 family RNA polymerase sigma factor [Planctomycetota bacterium]